MSSLELFGYLGSSLYLLAFYFNSKESDINKTYRWQILNIIAGSLSLYYSYAHGAKASVFSNSLWILISLKSLLPIIVKKYQLLTKELIMTKSNSLFNFRRITFFSLLFLLVVLPLKADEGSFDTTTYEEVAEDSTVVEPETTTVDDSDFAGIEE